MKFTLQQVRGLGRAIWDGDLSSINRAWYEHCFLLDFRQGDYSTNLTIAGDATTGSICCFTANFNGKAVRVVAERWYGSEFGTVFTVSGDPGVDESNWLSFLAELGYLFNERGYLDLNQAALTLDSINITTYPEFIIGA